MQFALRVLSLTALTSSLLALACDKSTPDTQPPTEQPAATTTTVANPGVWGDGSMRGTVTLKWGAAVPDGSTLQLRVYKGGEVVHQHDLTVSGQGPWPFDFKVENTDGFADGDLFGLGATIVVSSGESWYRGDPLSVPIWTAGSEQGAVELSISPFNPAAVGDGPPK